MNYVAMKILFYLSPLILTACFGGNYHATATGDNNSNNFVSNGERIYFTGRSQSGMPINAIGGAGGMHRQMHGSGCASCHGDDREGRRLWPQFWTKAPALTAIALFGDNDHQDNSDGHGDHASYDSDSLSRAITQGLDPAGEKLGAAMPRWSMSDSDMNDLIAYLKQSHDHD